MKKIHLVVFSLLTVAIFSCRKEMEKEKFLLPNGFSGEVIIVFDQENGAAEKYDENGFRIYEIPENGILYSQFSPNEGRIDPNDSQVLIENSDGTFSQLRKYSIGTAEVFDSTEIVSTGGCIGGSETKTAQSFIVDTMKNVHSGKYEGCGYSDKLNAVIN